MELEALDAVLLDQPLGFARAHLALVRSMLAKHIIMSLFFCAASAISSFGIGGGPSLDSLSTGEHHQADLSFAVIRDRLLDGRPLAVAEVLVGGAVVFLAVVVERVPAAHFGVGVDVDGDKVGVIHELLRA
jgi:hypothetical protein